MQAKLNNFKRLFPTLKLLAVPFDANMAQEIMAGKKGCANRLAYQLHTTLSNVKRQGLSLGQQQVDTRKVRRNVVDQRMYTDQLTRQVSKQTRLDMQAMDDEAEVNRPFECYFWGSGSKCLTNHRWKQSCIASRCKKGEKLAMHQNARPFLRYSLSPCPAPFSPLGLFWWQLSRTSREDTWRVQQEKEESQMEAIRSQNIRAASERSKAVKKMRDERAAEIETMMQAKVQAAKAS